MQNEQKVFELHSEYAPTGDQPQAIEALVKGFQEGNQFQTLLGLAGTCNAQQSLALIAFLKAFDQFFDCLGLVACRLVFGV